MRRALAAVVVVAALLAAGTAAAQPDAAGRRIAALAPDLYLASDATRHTVYYVTPQGIVLADPLDVDFSTWLKVELDRRHPNRPVRFVLHTGHAAGRAAGAAVWTASAEVIAHETFTGELRRAAAADPAVYADVRAPESTFTQRRRITLGGRAVDIIHTGSADAAFLHFPDVNAVFGADAAVPAVAALTPAIVVPVSGAVITAPRQAR